jgi:hypothetical protein
VVVIASHGLVSLSLRKNAQIFPQHKNNLTATTTTTTLPHPVLVYRIFSLLFLNKNIRR